MDMENAVGEVAIANASKYLDDLCFSVMCNYGTTMSPFNAWLNLRG